MAKKKSKKKKLDGESSPKKQHQTTSSAITPQQKQAATEPKNSRQKAVKPEKIKEEKNAKLHIETFQHKLSGSVQKFSKVFLFFKPVFRILKKIFLAGLILAALGTLLFVGVGLIFGRDLPDVTKLREMNFAQTTHIYDRNGVELYKIFQENREYAGLEEINPGIIKALIAMEDKNFYHHIGVDPAAIVRAILRNVQDDTLSQGASTLTQQLARNIFLDPDKTYVRKIKEILLALQIEYLFDKDQILEMYLNKISFGNNAFGIEAAAQTYFGVSAKNVSLVQASILASLPKTPSYYSPYGPNAKELMGYCKTGDETPVSIQGQEQVEIEQLNNSEGLTLTIKPQWRLWVRVIIDGAQKDYILNPKEERVFTASKNFQISLGHKNVDLYLNGKKIKEIQSRTLLTYNLENWKQFVENGATQNEQASQQDNTEVQSGTCTSPDDPNYVWGRKDLVLNRMVIEKYITKEQMLEAWKKGFKLKFKEPVHNIKAPHFVFYVRDILEKKYGKEVVEKGGLQVTTTLDYNLQQIGEKAVETYAEKNERVYKANNDALIALDPKTGEILAMVGSRDYWNNEIDGQVNITTSLRQPGSSFKPFVYAAAIEKEGIGSGTYLNDYKTVFNKKDVPQNYDGRFLGKMTIRKALGGSRNIPAIKAYYVAGEEEKLLDFVDKLGMVSLRQFRDEFNKDADKRGWTFYYGWPMAIGSGEVRLIDLAGGYAAFANGGKYIPPYPILEVRDSNGVLLEKYESENHATQAMNPQTAYIISSMLSDVNARPAGSWRNQLTIPKQNVAAKTGTSNKVINGVRLPNNNLTVGFTPSLTIAVWSGNTDGTAMRNSAYGLYTTDPIYHQFLVEALKDKEREEFVPPEGIKVVGKEIYPSWGDPKKSYEKMFKRIKPPAPPEPVPLPDFIPISPEERARAEQAQQEWEKYQKEYGDDEETAGSNPPAAQ